MEINQNYEPDMKKSESMPFDLRCEYAVNPLGIDTGNPRFSWKIESSDRCRYQTAYRIKVSSDIILPGSSEVDMWDSGIVHSSESAHVVYEGKHLESRKRYFWSVQIYDEAGLPGPVSPASWFETAFLDMSGFKACWIGSPVFGASSPMFRKEFEVNKAVKAARAYISGLGYYEMSMNGIKVGDRVLDPAWTDYSKRVLYSTYDVTEYLQIGVNAVGIMLGNGWYVNAHLNLRDNCSSLQMIFQMNILFEDGDELTITSDVSSGWKVYSHGPVTKNSIYDGECYDARLEVPGWDSAGLGMTSGISGQLWQSPILMEGPEGKLESQCQEPIKIIDDLLPVKVYNPSENIYVYDFGQNFCGWARLRVKGKSGAEVKLRFAEVIDDDMFVNMENIRAAKATDIYTLKGGLSEAYEPRFTYHGFRYIQLEASSSETEIIDITGRVIRSALEKSGRFSCSNKLLNQIQHCAVWTEASNLMGLPTDCPQRDERLGWLNDATVRTEESVYNFNMVRLLEKWEKDIADTQGKITGAIADTAPFYRFGRRPADPVCSSYLIVPWFLYLHYGDKRILENHYDGMKRWEEYLFNNTENYILHYSSYGDWAAPVKFNGEDTPVSSTTPGALMSTGYFYYNAVLLAKIAGILGKNSEQNEFEVLAGKIKQAFNREFFNYENNSYATGSQASNIFPLYLGIVPEERRKAVTENIISDIMNNEGHLTTGNLCSRYVLDVLINEGREDEAYSLATQTTYPSWGYMLSNGATTIWERWEYVTSGKLCEMASHNHPMYASISAWFYKMLAGISVNENGPGFKKIIIKPHLPEGLTHVEAELNTVKGVVAARTEKIGNVIKMNVCIPFNSSAQIFVMKTGKYGNVVKESDNVIWKNDEFIGDSNGIISGYEYENYIAFETGSGSYYFESSNYSESSGFIN